MSIKSLDIVPLPPVEPTRGYGVMHAVLYLGVSAPSVYKLIRDGKLVTRKVGAKRIVPGSSIIAFLSGVAPTQVGDPIEPRASERARIGGRAGGAAKAAKAAKAVKPMRKKAVSKS